MSASEVVEQSQAMIVVHDLQRQAVMRPHEWAVTCKQDGLTYAQLNVRSNQLARFLMRAGVQPNTSVALMMDRSLDMMVAIWGVLKAGGAYLPLDPIYPSERLHYMYGEADPVVTLTQTSLAPQVAEIAASIICLDEMWEKIDLEDPQDVDCPSGPSDLAYILFTSGSTGKPKGVLIHHEALATFAHAAGQRYDIVSSDRVLQFGTLSFDIAVEEMFPTWHCGGTLILRPDVLPSFRDFHHYLVDEAITVLDLPTPYWHEWVLSMEEGEAPAPPEGLRLVIVGADTTAPERLASWHRIVQGRVRWINSYGPTETTVSATAYEPDKPEIGEDAKVVAIGRPLDHAEIYVLNDQLVPVGEGEVGGLYIGGKGVGRGYLNRPELTRERFVPNPFNHDSTARLYNTGDLVRHRPDGNLEFHGRQDDQVKIRGFRIELGEIESVLRQHPAVADAVVRPYEVAPHDSRLVAYVTSRPGQCLESETLRTLAQQVLPQYMCPVSYLVLEALPYNPNGKIDRQALPEPTSVELSHSAASLPLDRQPKDALEVQLAVIWANVLHVSQIGRDDNFFELGGNSLSAVRLFSRLERMYERSLPLATLVEAPTIRELAKVLRDDGWTPPWQCLVPLQLQGHRAPFFCVHAVGGNILSLRELALKLGTDQPFYALQSQGLDGREMTETSVESMAASYLDEIRTVQPRGPYFLGGQSSGGLIAYELAQRLRAAGETVACLFLIDTYPPASYDLKDQLAITQRLAFHATQLRRQGRGYGGERFRDHLTELWARASILCQQGLRGFGYYRHRPVPPPLRYRQVRKAIAEAVLAYHPLPLDGDLTLFRAQDTLDAYAEELLKEESHWASLVKGEFVCHSLEGGHNLERAPMVSELALLMKQSLDEASHLNSSIQV